MDIDLGMAMAIPFPIFSNPSVQSSNAQPAAKSKPNPLKGKQAPSKPSKFKGKDLDLDQGVFSEEEDPFPGTAELAELRDSLSRFRSTEEALERAMGLKDQQWNSMRASMKSRNRADSGITLGDDEDDDSKTIVPDITFEKVMSPTQMKTEETNQSLFQSAADILNRLTRNLNPKELQAVTQDSLDQFYTSLKDLETHSGAISPTSPNPNPNEPERVTVEDDSGKEFRHLFDDLETKEQTGFLTKLKFESSLWNSLSGYLKQVFSGYMGYLEATARALVPKSLSFLVWPALSYLVVLVFIGIITKSVIKTNWERVKDDVKALLDLLGAL